MSRRTPTNRNDPDSVLPLGKPGRSISIRLLAVFSFGFVTVANTPVDPSTRIGSSGGILFALLEVPYVAQSVPPPVEPAAAPNTQLSGDAVIVAGNVSNKTVLVRGELARICPVTRMP